MYVFGHWNFLVFLNSNGELNVYQSMRIANGAVPADELWKLRGVASGARWIPDPTTQRPKEFTSSKFNEELRSRHGEQ